MIIANPIYDIVFKELIHNSRIARFFIETLTGEQIVDLQPKPQEFQKTVDIETLLESKGLPAGPPGLLTTVTVFRLDYIATILTAAGEHKKVMIEVQKARNSVDVMRFRTYLAAQYMVEDEIQTKGGPQKKPLPIITIYLLGFLLPNIEVPVVKVERKYMDVMMHIILEKKSEFIEQLTHDAYFVQLKRISKALPEKGEKLNSKLEELLAVFEQKYFLDLRGVIKNYSYEITSPEIKMILEILEYTASDLGMRKEIEDEIELWRILDGGSGVEKENFESQLEWKENELNESKKTIEESKKTIEESKKTIEESKKTIEESKKTIEEKEKELEQNKKALEDALKELAEIKRSNSEKKDNNFRQPS